MDTSVSSRERLFSEIISERRRRYVVEPRMARLAVVENFDVLLDRRFRVGPCGVPLMMNHFRDRRGHPAMVRHAGYRWRAGGVEGGRRPGWQNLFGARHDERSAISRPRDGRAAPVRRRHAGQAAGHLAEAVGHARPHAVDGPALGQHNDEVLAALGYSVEDIAAFKDDGVL